MGHGVGLSGGREGRSRPAKYLYYCYKVCADRENLAGRGRDVQGSQNVKAEVVLE
jgi:hypothetical protein